MLEAKLQHASVLRRLFESIKDMVSDVNLDCDETGLRLQAMDSSHVALVALKLDDVGFVHFRCDRERSLGLNLASVCKVFKLCSNADSCSIQNEEDSDTVTFVFENEADEKLSSFSLRLMAIDQDALRVPEDETAHDVTVTMSAREFANVVRIMGEFSDSVRVEVDKLGVKFVTQGDLGVGEVLLKPKPFANGDDSGVEIKVNSPVCQTYAVKYLNYFAKAASLSSSVTLSLTDQNPIEVRFDILEPASGGTASGDRAGDESQGDEGRAQGRRQAQQPRSCIGHVKFFLAPKMDDDAIGGEEGGNGESRGMDDSMMDE
ncbi:proliferating cell nuclear antigen PCNA1 [Toxoplasma gondii TgCatPRC2]|uniref:DNA sliding clamp PCNA n=15 Tax=Toxoplasma gondii TaxID=5811 RepID=B9PPR0_TOXGV|nr:proliferating cell nuclear antigen PCNA1 [Toxoplasma gondii ME49]EPR63667.1 proliferating cell nuclear antigen PCNA1 [Toxoplasma gondii GT1]ESS34360.1 proliferating cell nuclear antigen PCNA1 [Toxoplasma gondii VEG]KAF4638547.1 proliferating cell nuclear antigen PCNA1 [Toxoplasma gondii]KFG46764.1 proliferating cell nuclear antigen PCNA1 [Toxoplasma gondii GAB2-2007-GAL-DOM2]KFG48154.1 proliferating cell nuclear antigen PCNA1 [Toxoplasma gondii p89]KFG54014.1 proliferating cell nuclear ant|eukprot:XP_002367113.1 proliferating cell nuclear antigen PCNA1 [Toxoplasma gondii ME49]